MSKTGNGGTANLEKLLDDLKTVVRDGEDLLKVGAHDIRERTIAGARCADELVRNHPYQTLGIVLGAGLALGLLIATSCSARHRH